MSIRNRSDLGVRPHCQHCQRRVVSQPRGLCFTCYHDASVRYLYPSASPFARRGVEDREEALPATRPTDASPGTQEKLAVLCERAARGEELWHPDDRDGDAGHVGGLLTDDWYRHSGQGRRYARDSYAEMEAKMTRRGRIHTGASA